ncbi:MAG: hypothetical protein COX30_00370 [Candidatus Moranbacteria bacterium CG23_combo_of_CG06-09_8_20_14_all_39_10]|nr:MAG: hypothetical protein COX30_00370 [Candidatus Moranbacteria bacterium CG23_combo_of_CG06-09_8_20_14_all_39_10]
MTLKAYIWGIRLVTLLSFGAFVFVVMLVDPDSTGLAGKLFFYFSLFFVLSGIFNLFLLRLRKKSVNAEAAHYIIGLSFRQGILLACFAIGLLILQSLRILIWWDGLLLLAGIFIIELYFVSKD